MPFRLLTPADYRTMPWANGRGVTVELAREDVEGRMLWRLSRADVTEPGPFSILPGIDRILALIEGEGFDLDLGAHGGTKPVGMLEPIGFSGDWLVSACNLRGPSRDLNLMIDRDRAHGTMTIHRGACEMLASSRMALWALRGGWRLDAAGRTSAIAEGDLAILHDAAGEVIRAAGTGTLVAAGVRLR